MKSFFSFLFILSISPTAFAEATVQDLQHGWAIANYKSVDDNIKPSFIRLIEQAESAVAANPDDPELLIWQGIIKSTYAGKAGAMGGALGFLKAARASLEKAIEIDDMAMAGSAYTSLGALYYQVPGWPISFGNNKKARSHLEKALTINPDGLDSNYFYGDFLFEEKEYTDAKRVLNKALNAAPRPGRELADQGRRDEIKTLLEKIDKKLG
jgi:tetratricopeptide (TPR) repeat protein